MIKKLLTLIPSPLFGVVLLFYSLTNFSCQRVDYNLENALEQSGRNRAELEKVLDHYRLSKQSRKLKAAEFLIKNMLWKIDLDSASTAANDIYYDALAEYRAKNENYGEFGLYWVADSIRDNFPGHPKPAVVFNSDLHEISAQFLINHIDRAFCKKEEYPWSRKIFFNDFCNYILPYKTGSTHWSEAFQYFDNKYSEIPRMFADSSMEAVYKYIDEDSKADYWMDGTFFNEHYPFLHPITFRNVIKTKLGHCEDVNNAKITALRALGVPAVSCIIPYWGNSNASHTFIDVVGLPRKKPLYDNTQREFTSPEDILINDMFWINEPVITYDGLPDNVEIRHTRTIPKIYREEYAVQNGSIAFSEQQVPMQFMNPCLRDVTKDYIVCSDARVKIKDTDEKYAYLCCYNPDLVSLSPVAWATTKKGYANFKDMGINILYFPAFYINGKMVPAAEPFILRKGGRIEKLNNEGGKQQVKVLNKVPFRSNHLYYASALIGGKFMLSNDTVIGEAATIHTIKDVPFYEQQILTDDTNAYRFGIFEFSDLVIGNYLGMIAELEFYGKDEYGEEIKLDGKPIGNPGMYKNELDKAFDGDRVSFFFTDRDLENYIGVDFGSPQIISKIKYSPRSDDNGIVPGELYELFYWEEGWKSLGKKTGSKSYNLIYSNVPDNSLLRVHNHTRGKEHRPFTYRNGKQIFW